LMEMLVECYKRELEMLSSLGPFVVASLQLDETQA
jgi:hypothetical protein